MADDIFDLTFALALEYRLGLRAWTPRGRAALRSRGYTAQDHPFVDTFAIALDGKHGALINLIHQVPDGLSDWALHPAQAAAVDGGANVQQRDYDLLIGDEVRHSLAEEGIVVLGCGDAKLVAPGTR